MIKQVIGLASAGAAVAGALYLAGKGLLDRKKSEALAADVRVKNRDYGDRQAYIAGGGLGGMAVAAYLVRDAAFPGENIHIYEELGVLGGSNDGSGTAKKGYVVRGGRMMNEETYENFWELFRGIPSLEQPGRSVTEEILLFDHAHPTHARARLVDREANILDVHGMGFSNDDRADLMRLMSTPEDKLDNLRIQDWFGPHFFETNFWYMWQTTFAFQKWSSVFELRRYMNRMMLEFSRIETLEGVTRTPYNQYDSLILPLKAWLEEKGVDFVTGAAVTDLDFAEGEGITATALHLADGSIKELDAGDLCFVTNGCMTDSATLGDLAKAPPQPEKPAASAELWAKMAAKKPGLGNPKPFFGHEDETNWVSFTVTCKGGKLLKRMEAFSGNVPGSGALMTLKDSPWLLSTVVAAQPHFKNQDPGTTVFWGYGLYTGTNGAFVEKPMKDCTGEEILREWVCQMGWQEDWDEIKKDVVNVIPCYMPYIDAQFQPHAKGDRPPVLPEGSTNLALVSQFVEIPRDMVFTEEYSVRAARTAVYRLLEIPKEVLPVTAHNHDPVVLAKAAQTMYR